MAKKNFLLLSMEDDKIKKISNVISNESCRKILDYLSTKEATESELSKNLGIPISTVHYNLSQLVEAGLVDSPEFHYSEKGKEVNHYKLANKYIIIAPKNTFGIKEKLKNILPVALVAAGAAGILQIVTKHMAGKATAAGEIAPMMAKSAAMDESLAMTKAAPIAQATSAFSQNITLWFLAGAFFALAIYFILNLRKKDE